MSLVGVLVVKDDKNVKTQLAVYANVIPQSGADDKRLSHIVRIRDAFNKSKKQIKSQTTNLLTVYQLL